MSLTGNLISLYKDKKKKNPAYPITVTEGVRKGEKTLDDILDEITDSVDNAVPKSSFRLEGTVLYIDLNKE